MTLEAILKAQGLTDEQIKKIIDGMKENKIFTAGEEDLDTRYSKLKTDHESVGKQLEEANKLIEQLKQGAGGKEDIQGKIAEYETTIADLQKELKQQKLDAAVQVALLESGCKDVDYVTFKLKEKGELSLEESGKIKGIEDKLAALKTQFPAMFESKESGGMQVLGNNRLPENEERQIEPKNLAEALRLQYESNNSES